MDTSKVFKMKIKFLTGFLLLAIIFVDGIVPGNGFQRAIRRGGRRNCGLYCITKKCDPCKKLICINVPGKVY